MRGPAILVGTPTEDRLYAWRARQDEAGVKAEADYLQACYDNAVKECLGRLLPIQHHGHMLGLGDLRDQLRTGRPHVATWCRCVSHGCPGDLRRPTRPNHLHDDECTYCDGRGHTYPHGHEGEDEHRQPCWACEGTGVAGY